MRHRIAFTTTVLGIMSLTMAASIGISADKDTELTKAEQQIAERNARLEKLLTGCVLVGQFTVDGKPLSPKPERYEIKSVKRLEHTKNLWHLVARIKYGAIDADFPMNLPIEWADSKTPVMLLEDGKGNDMQIPLLGSFGGRVMFYGDRYVGSWQHGKVGGHMFGKIERAKKEDAKDGDMKEGSEKSKSEPESAGK